MQEFIPNLDYSRINLQNPKTKDYWFLKNSSERHRQIYACQIDEQDADEETYGEVVLDTLLNHANMKEESDNVADRINRTKQLIVSKLVEMGGYSKDQIAVVGHTNMLL